MNMPFLCGAFAGVRSRIGTGPGNAEPSRRHTISTLVTSPSPSSSLLSSGLAPAGTTRTDDSNAGCTTVRDEPPTSRNCHKSVTFSSVDFIAQAPLSLGVSVARPLAVSNGRAPKSDVKGRPSGKRSRYTVSRRFTSPRRQDTDSEHGSYSPVDSNRRLSYHQHTGDQHEYDSQYPSGHVASRRQSDSSLAGHCYSESWELPSPFRTPNRGRSLSLPFGVPPSIDSGSILLGQPGSSFSGRAPGYRGSYGCCHSSLQNLFSHVHAPHFRFSEPAGGYFPSSCNSSGPSVEYSILSLTCRLSPAPYARSESLAFLDTITASLISPYFMPPECFVEGTGIFFLSPATNKKGFGMFADRPIRAGEVILTEVPTLIISADAPNFPQNSLDASSVKGDMYKEIFGLLSTNVQRELIHLAGTYGNYRNAYETLMCINPLAVTVPLLPGPDGGSKVSSIHRGIFLKTSRCNHSCGPNAEWTFDPSSLTLFLTCLRPIDKGDEITIAYTSPYLPFFQRRANLKRLFGFDCRCDWCLQILSHPPSFLIEESDSTRKFLTTFWDTFPSFETWSKGLSMYPDDLRLISTHKAALDMIKREGLEVLSSFPRSRPPCCPNPRPTAPVPDIIRHTDGIALCYGALADVTNFQKWVTRALDVRRSSRSGVAIAGCLGAYDNWNGNVQFQTVRQVFAKWIKHPETFPAWGSRRLKP